MVEAGFGLSRKKDKKEKSPKETPTKELRDEEFTKRLERDINKAEWAPQLSSRLSEITLAELEERSPIESNLKLYSLLASKASGLSVEEGCEDDQAMYSASSTAAVRMAACIQIATEANRRIHDYMSSKGEKQSSK